MIVKRSQYFIFLGVKLHLVLQRLPTKFHLLFVRITSCLWVGNQNKQKIQLNPDAKSLGCIFKVDYTFLKLFAGNLLRIADAE